jgi:hypothetical protein
LKLSKQQSKLHQQAMDLVHSDRRLTWDERKFILDNYVEAQGQLNSLAGAFFTPFGLANDFAIEVGGGVLEGAGIVDLCAGIGALSFACQDKGADITCVEFCPAYVTVGRRVMPDAHWVESDVFLADYGRYAFAISNPPFGAIKGNSFAGKYTGGQFEYKVIELASRIADYGVFILPHMSAPFRYSGERNYREAEDDKARKFREQTGIVMEPNCGIDTAMYCSEWRSVSPVCEIVVCDFTQGKADASAVTARTCETCGYCTAIEPTQVFCSRKDSLAYGWNFRGSTCEEHYFAVKPIDTRGETLDLFAEIGA